MTACVNHPQFEAVHPCEQCGRPFCDRCLVEIMGRRLCGACKHAAVDRVLRPRLQHPQALWSLLVPVIGYVACAPLVPITSGVGIWLARSALADIRRQPNYSGRTLALVSLVVSWGTLATWIIASVVSAILGMRGAG